MANITTYLENQLLNHAAGFFNFSKPTTVYAALFTVTPTTAYTSNIRNGTEVTGGGYARSSIAWGVITSGAITSGGAANGVIANSTALTWTATGTWSSGASVTTIGIFDSGTVGSGNLLWFGPLSAPITMVNGDTFTIPVGNLTIAIS